MRLRNPLLVFFFFCSCQADDMMDTITNPNSGKLQKVSIWMQSETSNTFEDSTAASFTFSYSDDGQVVSIDAEKINGRDLSAEVDYVNDSTISIDWQSESFYWQQWNVLVRDGWVRRLNVLVFTGIEHELEVYRNDGELDSIVEPDVSFPVIPTTVIQGISHDYIFESGNCQEFQYSTYRDRDFEEVETIRFSYCPVESRAVVPEQIPYGFTNLYLPKIFSDFRNIDPLYILSVMGFDAIPKNRNLIQTRDELNYYYLFDEQDRVQEVSISDLLVIDTSRLELTYRLEYIE